MTFISSSWKQYFKNHHEGLGTTYERFILHRYFETIRNRYSIRSVIETPSFGMTGISGINSLWWAYKGCHVTILDDDKDRIDLIKEVWQEIPLPVDVIFQSYDYTSLPFEDNSFDMGWNFAAIGFVPNLNEFFKELTRISKRVIFICIPNRLNIFYRLRSMYQKKSDTIHEEHINPAKIKRIMSKLKWKIIEQGFLDVPPWPDIAMNKEDLLQKIGLRQLAKRLKNREGGGICILDYFSGKKKGMEREILKYAILENTQSFFKRYWAHHQYFVFLPMKK